MKCWEIIADNLSQTGWNFGCISTTDQKGRQFWVAAAERDGAGRFIVQVDEKLHGVYRIGKGCLYPPIERTMLTIIAATAASGSVLI
jgi:hypothetical protein